MTELSTLVTRSRAGDLQAYGFLVRHFQDMAVGYAWALTHDFHLAEDAAQEAFVRAYLDLGALREPATFPGWLRRIVFKQCDRMTRRKGLPAVSLETVGEIGMKQPGPDELVERQQAAYRVTAAVQALPENLRLAVNLFYLGEVPHREIADFLGTSVQTVKNRLHAARKRLRQELTDMAKKKLQERRPSRNDAFITHTMEELAGISDRGIQYLLRLTEMKDCVIALRGASDAVKAKILGNMSERVRVFVEEEMESMGEVGEEEIRRAQRAVMDHLWQVRNQPARPSEEYKKMKRDLRTRLSSKPVSRFSAAEIAELFEDLATIRSEEGVMALEEYEELVRQDPDDKLVAFGLGHAISGTGEENTDILEKRMRLLLREQQTRYRMITEGIQLLQMQQVSLWVGRRLRAHYALEEG